MRKEPYDIIGIGVGPFNLSLACLTAPLADLDCLFLERNAECGWHVGTLLQDATLQTPFLCDLVTLADPTSRFSLLNYMKEQGRIYSFYAFLLDTENFFLPRNEFNRYYQWAADQLDNVVFNRDVKRIDHDADTGLYRVQAADTRTGEQHVFSARHLVLAAGTVPSIPDPCKAHMDHIVHTASYMANREAIRSRKSITIVGSGQSAAEVYYDLLSDIDRYGYSLNWITRTSRFVPRELTKLTLQTTSPEYRDYFYSLPKSKRGALVESLKGIFQGMNPTLINGIYDLRLRKQLVCDIETMLMSNTEIRECDYRADRGEFHLQFYQREQEKPFELVTEALILGTGYRYETPAFLQPIADRINWSEEGKIAVARNCSIDRKGGEIFVLNAETHADCYIPADLGQACYRNSSIIRQVLGREVYPLEPHIAFQQFAVPGDMTRAPALAIG